MTETEQTTTNTGDFTLDDIYFKDAFTQTEDKLNLEVDNANISCLTSKNNKFSLDEDGNLIVNSITCSQDGTTNESLDFEQIYPIGSIYLTVNSANPSTLFGGIWEQLKDRFLLGAGDTYASGSTGGTANHLLSAAESGLRAHSHWVGRDNDANFGSNNGSVHANGNYTDSTAGANWLVSTSTVAEQPAQTAHNNMPPYLTVYMWKRIS